MKVCSRTGESRKRRGIKNKKKTLENKIERKLRGGEAFPRYSPLFLAKTRRERSGQKRGRWRHLIKNNGQCPNRGDSRSQSRGGEGEHPRSVQRECRGTSTRYRGRRPRTGYNAQSTYPARRPLCSMPRPLASWQSGLGARLDLQVH